MVVLEDLITRAIAELAKEEMAFTIGVGADGKKLYLLDSVCRKTNLPYCARNVHVRGPAFVIIW